MVVAMSPLFMQMRLVLYCYTVGIASAMFNTHFLCIAAAGFPDLEAEV